MHPQLGIDVRLELATLLLHGSPRPPAPGSHAHGEPVEAGGTLGATQPLDPLAAAEVAELLAEVLSSAPARDPADGGLSPHRLGRVHELRAGMLRQQLGPWLPALPTPPDQIRHDLATAVLDDYAAAIDAFTRAGESPARLLGLRAQAALIRLYGLGDRTGTRADLSAVHAGLVELLLRERRPGEIGTLKEDLHTVYRMLAELELDGGDARAAFAVTVSARGSFVNHLLAALDDDPGDLPAQLWARFTAARSRLDAAIDARTRLWLAQRAGEASTGQVREATARADQAERDLADELRAVCAVSPAAGCRLGGVGPGLTDLAARLDEGHALVEIHPLMRHTVAYVVRADGQLSVAAIGPGFADRTVSSQPLSGWLLPYEKIRERGVRDVGDLTRLRGAFQDTMRWFGATFDLAAIRPAIAGCHTITVIGHYPLSFLPLHAMTDDEGHCLLDDLIVRYLPTAAFLRADPLPGLDATARFTAVSNPRPQPPHHLSYSACETSAAAALYTDARILPGPAATRAAVLTALRDSAVIHLSCHGSHRYIRGHAYGSALLLAGEDTLSLADAFQWRGRDTGRLVVLSACDSGAEDPRAVGDEVHNFPAGFLIGGARAVVSTLWQVEERATAFLTHEFHRQLARGLPADQALRRAQLWLRTASGATLAGRADEMLAHAGAQPAPGLRAWAARRRDGERAQEMPYSDPFVWAAFQIWA